MPKKTYKLTWNPEKAYYGSSTPDIRWAYDNSTGRLYTIKVVAVPMTYNKKEVYALRCFVTMSDYSTSRSYTADFDTVNECQEWAEQNRINRQNEINKKAEVPA